MHAHDASPLILREPAVFSVRVLGALSPNWSIDVHGMRATITVADDAVSTELIGCLPSQAALLDVLNQLYDRGFPLLSMRRAPEAPAG